MVIRISLLHKLMDAYRRTKYEIEILLLVLYLWFDFIFKKIVHLRQYELVNSFSFHHLKNNKIMLKDLTNYLSTLIIIVGFAFFFSPSKEFEIWTINILWGLVGMSIIVLALRFLHRVALAIKNLFRK